MDTNTRSVATVEAGPEGEGDLSRLLGHLQKAERHLAQAVLLAGRLAGSGTCERVEGLPLELWLGLAAHMTGSDRRTLVAAGETLRDLPTVARRFRAGELSWGQVRAIVAAARRLDQAARAELDDRLAATLDDPDLGGAFDPDGLLWAVEAAAEDLTGPRRLERTEQRRQESSFLAVQQSFDGGVRLYGEYDAVTGASIVGTLDAAAGPPRPEEADPAADETGRTDQTDQADQADRGNGWSGTSRGRQYAGALARICAEWQGGKTARAARPLLTVHVDIADCDSSAPGLVDLGVRGGLPRVTAATIEALAGDADVQAVLFDGARPLAVTRKIRAADIPADIRTAVKARDRGCRFPGSADPLAHCDVHHTVHRADGGTHHPDGLVALSRRHHTLSHRRGWKMSIDARTGAVTATRGHRSWRSLPRGTRLARAPANRGTSRRGPPSDDEPLPF